MSGAMFEFVPERPSTIGPSLAGRRFSKWVMHWSHADDWTVTTLSEPALIGRQCVGTNGCDWIRSDAGAATPWERKAMRHGVEVCASRWRDLEQTVFSGLAPASDRSRLDAGATPDRQNRE